MNFSTTEQPTKTLDMGVTAADELSKRHLWYLDCGHLNAYCNRAAYYCDADGLLAYQYEEDTICNAYCKCQNMEQPARPLPPPVPKFSQSQISPPIPTVVPCPKGSIFVFCKEVDGKVVEHTGEVVEPTQNTEIRVTAANILSKRHLFYLDCGHLNGYYNREAYYCDGNGLLAYRYEADTLCSAYCKCKRMDQPPRPSAPKYTSKPPKPPVPPFSISSIISPPITSVIPCIGNTFWEDVCQIDKKVVENIGETVTLRKTPDTMVATTKPLDMEVTAPAALSKRHNYAMDCGAQQGFCTTHGYFCGANGKLHRRYNALSACNRACRCRSLDPKPLVISVVPCPKGSIFDLCKEVDEEIVEHNGTVGDAVESVEFKQTKTLDMEVRPTETLEQEVDSTQTSDVEVKAVDTLSKRHNYAMQCGTQQAFCTRYGYYCAANGRVYRLYNALSACDRSCTCVSLQIIAPKPNLFPVPCGLHTFCFGVDETEAERNGTVADVVGSDKVNSNKTLDDAVEPGEVESDMTVGDVAELEQIV